MNKKLKIFLEIIAVITIIVGIIFLASELNVAPFIVLGVLLFIFAVGFNFGKGD